MTGIIERNVPIAEENVTLTGHPASNKYDDWGDKIDESDVPSSKNKHATLTEEERARRLKAIDEVVKEDLKEAPST